MYDPSFEFNQNASDQNAPAPVPKKNKRQLRQPSTRKNHVIEGDRKIIISNNPSIGINMQEHLSTVLTFYQQKVLKENILKAVLGTFERKNILQDGQFKKQMAFSDAEYQSKAYVDRIQSWLSDSIANSPALLEFEKYKKKKFEQRSAKIASIQNLIEKIAQKAQSKKLQQIKREYGQSLEDKKIKFPQNNEYNRAKYKLRFLKQRVANNKKKIQDNHSANYSQ